MNKYFLILTTFNRPEYLKITLDSLKKSDLSLAEEIFISDDGSSQDIIKMLYDFKNDLSIPVNIEIQKIKLGADLNILKTLEKVFISKNTKYVISLDSDSDFGSQWLNKLDETVLYCEENNLDWGFISVFNTINHKIIKEISSNLVQKKDIGSFGAIYESSLFFSTLRNSKNMAIKTSFDWKYCWQCDLEHKLILSTKNSYIQHIGYNGMNSNPSSIDIGTNFIKD